MMFQPRTPPAPQPIAEQASATSTPTELDRALVAFRESLDPLHAYAAQMEATVAVMMQAMKRLETQYDAPLMSVVQLNSNPYTLHLHGRQHNAIFLPTAAQLTATIPGLGTVTLNLAVGWNALELPEGTTLTSGSTLSVLYRVATTRTGDAI